MLVLLDDKCDKTNTEVKMRPEKIQACTGFAPMTFVDLGLQYQPRAGHYVGSKRTCEVMNR